MPVLLIGMDQNGILSLEISL